jgi:tetratricopeptide (TPR) repeat protein
MLGFELGPHNETTGTTYRAATFPPGQALANRAVKLGPSCSQAAVVNSTALVLDWQWAGAIAEAHRAVRLNKSDPDAWAWLSKVQTALVDLDGAIQSATRAEGLDPMNTGIAISTGAVMYMRRDWKGLKTKMLTLVQHSPQNVAGWDWLAMAYNGLGDYPAAVDAYHKAISLAPDDRSYPLTELQAGLGHSYALAGMKDEAQAVLTEMYTTAQTKYMEPVRLAFIESALGNVNNTLARLNEAVALKQWELAFLRTEPWFDPVRNSTGFAEIVRRVGLPPKPKLTALLPPMLKTAPSLEAS